MSDLTISTFSIGTTDSFDDDDRLDDYSQVSKTNNKISRAIVTLFPPNKDEKWLRPETYFTNPRKLFGVWCGQFEGCPTTGNLHCHIYFERQKTACPRFQMLRKAFGEVITKNCNIKKPRSCNNRQRQGAINYCLCGDKRLVGTESFVWEHCDISVEVREIVPVEKQTTKSDTTEDQRLWIESKPRWWTWDEIVHEGEESKKLLATCTWGAKYHNGRYAEVRKRTINDVVILYGAGGTGKTTLAVKWDEKDDEHFFDRYYKRNPDDGVFWGGGRTAYKGQRVIHLEEFCGQEPFHRFKEITDLGKYGPPVNIKNGGLPLNHETVVVTSNFHPASWYYHLWEKDNRQFQPFWRRISRVCFFPELRPDGTLNAPTDEIEPYYIDQTEEWIHLGGDFNEAKKHAEKYWPLTEDTGDGAFSKNFFRPPAP